ncbi:MAG: EutN/CcmL family microcompartment protein [Planctomycetaceae bacterium]|jgi:ethanolamine utilization protein EutN|nr:EutN/CcmL family microcompartment protein [Planctomycetaceae bacterium]
MKIGEVVGTVTLSRVHPLLTGTQWSLVSPLTLDSLTSRMSGKNEELVIYDELNAGIGEWVAFSEGAEAAMPFYPNLKPVDAYCTAILDTVEIDHEAIEKIKR